MASTQRTLMHDGLEGEIIRATTPPPPPPRSMIDEVMIREDEAPPRFVKNEIESLLSLSLSLSSCARASADGRVGVRVAESSQRRPETQSRRSRGRAAAAEERRRKRGPQSRGGGRGNKCGAAAKRTEPTATKRGAITIANNGAEERPRNAADAEDNRAQRRRDPRCRRRALQRKERAIESRSTSTMTETMTAAVVARIVRRRRRVVGGGEGKKGFAERGVDEDGFLVLPFLCCDKLATDQRQKQVYVVDLVADLSRLRYIDRRLSLFSSPICRRSVTNLAGNLWREKSRQIRDNIQFVTIFVTNLSLNCCFSVNRVKRTI
ncbi:hypothetical protein Scep_024003 [Stephania cephalantha]|uniref:Uncharacterized protein n=1 Tax=Stephania cephalantha TaxID=152367 RepID=A0AAP0HTA7_9MAGN